MGFQKKTKNIGPKIRVRVEDFFNHESISIDEKGNLIVKVSFPEDDWVYSFIVSYAEYVEVLEPLHIKKIIQKKIKNIFNLYNPDIQLSQ